MKMQIKYHHQNKANRFTYGRLVWLWCSAPVSSTGLRRCDRVSQTDEHVRVLDASDNFIRGTLPDDVSHVRACGNPVDVARTHPYARADRALVVLTFACFDCMPTSCIEVEGASSIPCSLLVLYDLLCVEDTIEEISIRRTC
jgi:hypothetical protein